MFRWIGDIIKKVIINLLTIAIVFGALWFFVFKNIF